MENKMMLLAGPCVIEDMDMLLTVATSLRDTAATRNLDFYFKASYDKANRRDGSLYRGPGLSEGLRMLAEVKKKTGVKIVTDVHHPEDCQAVAKVADIVQIPAGLCRQTDLVTQAAKYADKIMIKKGVEVSAEDMKNIAAKARSLPKDRIILCERGSAFGYGELVVDFRNLAKMGNLGYPVVFDCTHSTNKQREYAPMLAKAALATGHLDGLFMEVHPDPDNAPCDGPCMMGLGKAESVILTIGD